MGEKPGFEPSRGPSYTERGMAKARDTAPKEANGYSGRLLLRMPPELHAEAARVAERGGVSLNQFITGALADAVGSPVEHEPESAPDGAGPQAASSRLITAALAVNFIVVTIAGAVAITLLVVAWQRGL
jgi:hypothetical protein